MKNKFLIIVLSIFLCTSCSKKAQKIESKIITDNPTSESIINKYVEYSIAKGSHYCDKSSYTTIKSGQLIFKVKFDSSSIYQTSQESNQTDINKLFGFSDNNAAHHEYSARFGWRWSNNSLHLFAYVYNKSVMIFKEIGTVQIGEENTCALKVAGDKYKFTLNDKSITIPRESTTALAEGYKLWPYFGGNETAPHTISIWIMELPGS